MPSVLKHIPNPNLTFIPIDIKQDKVNKAFTNNHFLLSQSLTQDQNKILKYIIAKVDSIGVIKLNYTFIDNYRQVLKLTLQSSLQYKKRRINVSRSKVVEDIIFLIETRVILRIMRNKGYFILNPCYVFTKANTSRESTCLKFAKEWVELSKSGQISEETVDSFAMRYYHQSALDRINNTHTPHYTKKGREKHLKGDKLYQSITKILSCSEPS